MTLPASNHFQTIMKIADLLNLEVEEVFPFRGNDIYLICLPDIYAMSDLRDVDEASAEGIAEFLIKGVKEFGVKEGETRTPLAAVRERKAKCPELTKELLVGGIPITLARQMVVKVQGLWVSPEGKPTLPVK